MAVVIPFKAVRPTRDKANLVVSRSYHIYNKEGLAFRLKNNPYSFLHILNPGYKFEQKFSGKERFKMVRNRYLEFKDEGFLKEDSKAQFALYKMTTRTHTFCGIIGATAIKDYEENRIKTHENTIEEREILFKDYLNEVGFNTEPVLLTYPNNNTLSSLFRDIMENRSDYEFSTTDRVTHHLWLIDNPTHENCIQQEFSKMESLYIADGHHRTASSHLLAQDYKKDGAFVPGLRQNYFMSYLIPEDDLKIYEFYRLISDLNGLTKKEFLILLDNNFRIENRGIHTYTPSKKHHFSMYLDGEFYSLYLRKSKYTFATALEALDTQILYDLILNPILGITDLRNNTRIDYLPGTNDISELKEKVDNKDFKVAFGTLPIHISQMKAIADQGLKMPPKSTYIEPKLRSGLTIYEF